MTVKELINKLLDCRMDATVNVFVEIDKDTIQHTLDEYGDCTYPIDDDIDIDYVNDMGFEARICLKDFKQ